MEIVVGANYEAERAVGWCYYLEDKLIFPFKAKCIVTRKTSPLVIGEEVEVTKMAPDLARFASGCMGLFGGRGGEL